MITLHKRIEKDEKEILDKEFYKKKYEKFLEEKDNSDKEKTGFSKTNDKKEAFVSDENSKGLNKKNQIPAKLVGKNIADAKKKQRKVKDRYECNNKFHNLFTN